MPIDIVPEAHRHGARPRRKAIEAKPAEEVEKDPLVGQVIGGVKLLRRLGSGALGVVYEGIQESLGRRVAVKMLSNKSR